MDVVNHLIISYLVAFICICNVKFSLNFRLGQFSLWRLLLAHLSQRFRMRCCNLYLSGVKLNDFLSEALIFLSFIWSVMSGERKCSQCHGSQIKMSLFPYMGHAMRKHMRTAEVQISLRIRAVWSGPSQSAIRITGYYSVYQWRAKTRMRPCACAG